MNISFVKDKLGNVFLNLKKQSAFTQSFVKGVGGAIFLIIVLFAWMALNADETAQKIDSLALSKTTLLELPQAEQASEKNTPSVKLPQEKNIIALTPAPIEGFFEELNGQFLPKKNPDGVMPFDAYKRPFIKKIDGSTISIVVVDFGLSGQLSDKMIGMLPPDITLVLSPYSESSAKWAASARSFGHEFWLSLPMQTKNLDKDTGGLTLLKNAVEQQNNEILLAILASSSGYAGVVSSVNHDFDHGVNSLKPVMNDISKRGLGFVEINPDVVPIGAQEFLANNAPYGQNDVWLDIDLKPKAIESAIINLEQKAKRDSHVIAFTHPYPSILTAISEWSKTLNDKNIQLAPLSATIKPE